MIPFSDFSGKYICDTVLYQLTVKHTNSLHSGPVLAHVELVIVPCVMNRIRFTNYIPSNRKETDTFQCVLVDNANK